MKKSFLTGGWGAIVPLTAAFGVYLFFVFLPGMKDIHRMRSEMETKEIVVQVAAAIPDQLKQIDQEFVDAHRYLEKWRGVSNKPSNIAELFGRLSNMAKASGVATTTFRPETKQAYATLERIPLTLGCRGTPEQVQTLLSSIELLNQRLWVDDVTIERSRQDGKSVTCELKLAIFADNFEISD
ncbi:MAG: type II secretion system protein M [Planctomycetia bacterium]|nr:type II secretion system protein M [Planctomycetia bacterium]